MGFLDFLKKDNVPKDNAASPVEAPPSPSTSMDEQEPIPPPVGEPLQGGALTGVPEPTPQAEPAAAPPEEMFKPPEESTPAQPPLPRGLDEVPLPPDSMQDPDVQEHMKQAPERIQAFTVTAQPGLKKQKIKDIVLPDFSDEDIAAIAPRVEEEQIPEESEQVQDWETPAEPAPLEEPKPSQEPEREEIHVEPLPPHPSFKGMEPAKFLSSDEYFMIVKDIGETRTLLREGDYALLDAMSYHEKGDDKLEKFASMVNEMQESLSELDATLFEG